MPLRQNSTEMSAPWEWNLCVTERLERTRGTVTGEFPQSAVFRGATVSGSRRWGLRCSLRTASGKGIHLDEQTA